MEKIIISKNLSGLNGLKENNHFIDVTDVSIFTKKNKNVGYEIINNDLGYIKPYFDIDLKDEEKDFKKINSNKPKFLSNIKKILKKHFKIKNSDIAISETKRKNKISYHLVIHNKKILWKSFKNYMLDNFEDFNKYYFDKTVYNKGYQKFRLINCCKESDGDICKPLNNKKNLERHYITNTSDIDNIIKLDKIIKPDKIDNKKSITHNRLCELVLSLNSNRFNYNPSWGNIIKIIYDLSNKGNFLRKGLNLIHDVSKKSKRYDEQKVDKYISNLIYKEDNTSSIDSILNMLREDKKDLFDLFKLETYGKTKDEFEKTHFKIMDPICYVTVQENKLIIRNRQTFIQAYENKFFKISNVVKDKAGNISEVLQKKPFLQTWFTDPLIRTYECMNFYPDASKCPTEEYNLFRGFKADNNDNYDNTNNESIQKILDHIKILVNQCESSYNYFIKYLSDIIQNPAELSGVSLVFKSKQGSGKGIFFNFFGSDILGDDYFYSTADINNIFGTFATGLKNKLLVNLDEASGKDTFMHNERLKNLITAPIVTYSEKYITSYDINNFARFVFTTNNNTPVKIELSDRRYGVFECSSEKCLIYSDERNKQNIEYFKELKKVMDNKQVQKDFFNYLKNMDLTEFNIKGDRPKTELYKEIQQLNIPLISQFLIDLKFMNNEKIYKNVLYKKYIKWLDDSGYDKTKRQTNRQFFRNINKYIGISKLRNRKDYYYKIDTNKLNKFLVENGHKEEDKKNMFRDKKNDKNIFLKYSNEEYSEEPPEYSETESIKI